MCVPSLSDFPHLSYVIVVFQPITYLHKKLCKNQLNIDQKRIEQKKAINIILFSKTLEWHLMRFLFFFLLLHKDYSQWSCNKYVRSLEEENFYCAKKIIYFIDTISEIRLSVRQTYNSQKKDYFFQKKKVFSIYEGIKRIIKKTKKKNDLSKCQCLCMWYINWIFLWHSISLKLFFEKNLCIYAWRRFTAYRLRRKIFVLTVFLRLFSSDSFFRLLLKLNEFPFYCSYSAKISGLQSYLQIPCRIFSVSPILNGGEEMKQH